MISGDREAYVYLPHSIMEFPRSEEVKLMMEQVGLGEVHFRFLTWGVVAIYVGTKQKMPADRLSP
jgi:demethylmenaquinone methyltransferase/2-methoxy-6-polyprenyl-1,4-benzoquinol methylase